MFIFSNDLGIDLGTSYVRIYQAKKGVVLREPSVVALNKNTGVVVQTGTEARNMMGRTPGNLITTRPLRRGVIADYELTARLLKDMVHKVIKRAIVKPRVIINMPCGITEVEERAVLQAVSEAGARRVCMLEAPLLAGLGAQLNVSHADGHMVVDIGGGTTDIGVLTLNGVALAAAVPVAGMTFDEAIVKYLLRHHGVIVSESIAEDIKLSIGCVEPRPDVQQMVVKGRDAQTGLAKQVVVTSEEMLEALRRPARQIADEVVDVLRRITPELVSDVQKNGIVLTGGGSQLWGMDVLLQERTGMKCMLADDAESCVIYGCGKSLSRINRLDEGSVNSARRQLLKD